MSQFRDLTDNEIKCILYEGNISPLAVPMESGIFCRSITEQRTNGMRDRCVVYFPKKGKGPEFRRVFCDCESLADFLQTMGFVNLDIAYFCFDPSVNAYDVFQDGPKESYDAVLVRQDIAAGKEFFPVPVVNAHDSPEEAKTIIPHFKEYITRNEFADDLDIGVNTGIIDCCECEDNCKDKLNCRCFQLTLANCGKERRRKFGEENIGYTSSKLLLNDHLTVTGIFECNKQSCWNRVVQNGSKWRFQMFRSAKGWGVKTLTDIPRGSFVTTYSGVIINDSLPGWPGERVYTGKDDSHKNDAWRYKLEFNVQRNIPRRTERALAQRFQRRSILNCNISKRRQGGTFMNATPKVFRRVYRTKFKQLLEDQKAKDKSRFSARTQPTDKFCLDGKERSNIGKFLNHSCNPNLNPQYVFIDSHDLRFPNVCFFADRNIRAGDELTWSYNYAYQGGRKPNKCVIECLCGSSNCSRIFL